MILVTGSTGFLGRELVARLLRLRPDAELCLLVRDQTEHDALRRVRAALEDIFEPATVQSYLQRIHIVRGDISEDRFGLGDTEYTQLASKLSAVYHSAATTTLNHDLPTARRVNVGGTQHVLDLAEQSARHYGSDFRLYYISTAYVAGARKGIVRTDELDPAGSFRNAYERSKAEAEALVRSRKDFVSYCIFRPSIIVGDSVTGQTSAFNVIYGPAKLLVKGLMSRLPALPHAPFDIVPVDYVADTIVYLSAILPSNGACYHISAGVGRESNPWEIVEQLFSTFNKHRRRGRGLLPMPALVPAEVLALAQTSLEAAKTSMKTLERLVTNRISVFAQTLPFIPYLVGNPQFENSDTIRDTGSALSLPPLFPSYAERLFMYCLHTNWGKLPWTNPHNFTLWRNRTVPFSPIVISQPGQNLL
ncbi:MAG: SDR family oxidoreductase [Bdellovibrionota bacterium]